MKKILYSTLGGMLLALGLLAASPQALAFSGSGSGAAASPYLITTAAQLDEVRDDLAASYQLANDISLTAYLATGAGYAKWGSAGWMPIGTSYSTPFIGSFDGAGHKITGLWINRPSTWFIGLFGYIGYIQNATISNLGLEIADAGIIGSGSVGGLVGFQNGSTITNSYVIGNVSGFESNTDVGGLVGSQSGTIVGTIANSYASGNISGLGYVGGLVGYSLGGITNSYATGSAIGAAGAGGLVGYLQNGGSIANSYATGNVTGNDSVTIMHRSAVAGGLVGVLQVGASITNSYAAGSVTGINSHSVGGLAGTQGGSIASSYATGSVSGDGLAGGLVGEQYDGSITASFFDSTVSPALDGVGTDPAATGVTGKTTAQMKTQSTFTDAGWDFTSVWRMPPGGYPQLLWQQVAASSAPSITSANNTSVTAGMGGTFQMTASGTTPIAWSLTGTVPAGVTINDSTGLMTVAATVAANTYTFTVNASNGTPPNATQSFTLTVNPAGSGSQQFTSPVAIGTGTMTAQITGGGAGCVFNPAATQMTAPSGSTPYQMPYGLFAFELVGCTPGSQVTVTTTWPSLSGVTGYMKYGRTPASGGQAVWYAPDNVQIAGNTITYTVRDGGLGDDDLSADGVIRDPGGPVVTSAGNPAAVPALNEWALALLAVLLAGVAWRRRV